MISGAARIAGVIGWPVAHSASPLIHGTWLAEHRIDGAYVPLPVRPEKLAVAVKGLAAAGFRGFNITLPHKEAIIPLLDEISDEARAIGAVNTVVVHESGRLVGSNSDVVGFTESLVRIGIGRGRVPTRAAVLGAGGAARAVLASLLNLGVPEIHLFNRSRERAEILKRSFVTAAAGKPATNVEVGIWGRWSLELEACDLLVNATSLGMAGQPDLEIDLRSLPDHAAVVDIVYTPQKTELLKAAHRRGLETLDGLWMLLHQARPGFAVWFGVTPSVTEALHAHIAEALTTC